MVRVSGRLRLVALLFLACLTSCELTEVTIADGAPTVVVHAVLRRGPFDRYVVLEWSRSGRAEPVPEDASLRIPDRSPENPVTGAAVVVSGPVEEGSGCSADNVFVESPTSAGVYLGPSCLRLFPGDQLVMNVTLPGHTVTGSLTVPGIDSALTQPFPSLSGILFNHDRDTLRLLVHSQFTRGLEVSIHDRDRTDDPVFYTLTDTMGLALRGNLVNPFEGDDDRGESVFRPGRSYRLFMLAADSNYYDFLRSFNDPFTGRGFINHLTGGIGVFGSVDVVERTLRVVADMDDPREGRYQVQGSVSGRAVDTEWELYLDGAGRDVPFAAFTSGIWEDLGVTESVDGFFAGDSLVADIVRDPDPAQPGLVDIRHLRGRFSNSGTFSIQVQDGGFLVIGSLVFTRTNAR